MQPMDLLPNSILSLSGETADRLLALNDPDAALLYLHLLRRGNAQNLAWPVARLHAARDRLVANKLLAGAQAAQLTAAQPEPAQEAVPEYTTADITQALAGASPFSSLADEVERRLGKKLSTPDLKTLFSLYDQLALPPEVILMILTWCIQEQERKYGPGRRPFLSTIRREAAIWARTGVDTVQQANSYLTRLQTARAREREVARLLELPDRELVERERKYITQWLEQGFSDDALRLAYEKTVMGTASKSMDWRYMNGILRRWHEKGLHTAAQVEQSERAPRTGGSATPPAEDSALRAQRERERTRRLLEKMSKEQGG